MLLRRFVVAGAALASLLGACSQPAPEAAAPSEGLTGDASEDLPSWFIDRVELPSCGRLDADEYEDWELRARGIDCIATAYDEGREAELAMQQLTDEGAPIERIYRVLDGRLDIMYDTRQDPLGSEAIGWISCAEATFLSYRPVGSDCAVIEGPPDAVAGRD